MEEEEKNKGKQYNILCTVSFIIVLEIALLKILDLFGIIIISKFGFDLISYSCITAFVFSIVGLIKFNSNKSKGKWMGIIGILIKTDVGGFGSTVLYPLLKDVPYVNKILPQPEETVEQTEGTEHQYGSLSEAISQIKELEKELDEASSTNKNDKKKIKDLKAQIKDLSKYKEDEAAFEKEKEKYYEEVVFSDQAPDIQQYKTYYESIDPENAEVLYKQVVEQITYDSQVEDYAKTYSNMKPQEAASIFDTMTDNLGLVAVILMNMGTQQRADILGKMDATTAAKLTEIMEPTKKK